MITIYEVGGSVRDELLNISSKDKDFVVIVDSDNIDIAWDIMVHYLEDSGYQIFLQTKECYTIRAKFPVHHANNGIIADFVLARKEIGYYPGTRWPILIPGTINDDIFRRDFCCNALYKDENGSIIDLTGRGINNTVNRILTTPLDPLITFRDDPLRVFRAIRFAITKDFSIPTELAKSMNNKSLDFSVVSYERVREELAKCFKHDTIKTLDYLQSFINLRDYAFGNKLWLQPTLKDK